MELVSKESRQPNPDGYQEGHISVKDRFMTVAQRTPIDAGASLGTLPLPVTKGATLLGKRGTFVFTDNQGYRQLGMLRATLPSNGSWEGGEVLLKHPDFHNIEVPVELPVVITQKRGSDPHRPQIWEAELLE